MERLRSLQEELLLETPRLFLRIFNPEDVTAKYVAALNDPEVVGLTESRYRESPLTIDDVKEYAEKSNSNDSIFLGIFEREGNHVGNIRLHTISLTNKRAELGIMIWDKKQWSKGYATEALRAVVDYAFSRLNLHKIEAEYYSTNHASARIFEKAGFVVEGIIKDHFVVNGQFADAVKIAKFSNI